MPFGKASARQSRGAPFAQTNSVDYGGSAVGDKYKYKEMLFSLRGQSNDTIDDPTLAEALRTLSDVNLADEAQKYAAAKLTTTVYLPGGAMAQAGSRQDLACAAEVGRERKST
jgi:hypothetical protein